MRITRCEHAHHDQTREHADVSSEAIGPARMRMRDGERASPRTIACACGDVSVPTCTGLHAYAESIQYACRHESGRTRS